MRKRLLVSSFVALCCALYVVVLSHYSTARSDFDHFHAAARIVWAHGDPYAEIGPGLSYPWPWRFHYPLTTALAVLPISWLRVEVARPLFAALSGGVLCFALTRDNFSRLPALMSMSFLLAIQWGQWAPVITAAILMPSIGWLMAVKPNVGVIAGAGSKEWRRIAVASVVFLLLSLIADPWWPLKWFHVLSGTSDKHAYVMRPGGFVLLLAALRWRRPEARFFVALAVVPITSGLIEALLVFALPWTFRQALVLALLTHLSLWLQIFLDPSATGAEGIALGTLTALWCVYVPAMGMVVWRDIASSRSCR